MRVDRRFLFDGAAIELGLITLEQSSFTYTETATGGILCGGIASNSINTTVDFSSQMFMMFM